MYEQIIHNPVQPELLEPNLDEIKMIINFLKNNKAPGEYNNNTELLKLAGPYLATQIQKLIGNI